jgi:hypothetical protein
MGCNGGGGNAGAIREEDLAIGCDCVGKAIGCLFAIAGPAAHQALGGVNGGLRIGNELSFGRLPDEDGSARVKVDDTREKCIPGLRVGKDGWNPINGGCNE